MARAVARAIPQGKNKHRCRCWCLFGLGERKQRGAVSDRHVSKIEEKRTLEVRSFRITGDVWKASPWLYYYYWIKMMASTWLLVKFVRIQLTWSQASIIVDKEGKCYIRIDLFYQKIFVLKKFYLFVYW